MKRHPAAVLLRSVRVTIAEHAMLAAGDRVVVAVSGGPDSTALLGILHELSGELGIELIAAHFHHGSRGAEADLDQACAQANANDLGIPFRAGRAIDLLPGANFEARARAARYAFLEDVAAAESCCRIATGHTLDDQAETVMMRLLRGSGLRGVRGILPVRGARVIRPLLGCRRSTLIDYLGRVGLPYRIDASNADPRFLRNRVRRDLMPALNQVEPKAAEALGRFGGIAAGEHQLLQSLYRRHGARCIQGDGRLSLAPFLRLPRPLQMGVLQRWLDRVGDRLGQVEFAHLEAIAAMAAGAKPSGTICLPGSRSVEREYDHLRLVSDHPSSEAVGVHLTAGGADSFGPWSFATRITVKSECPSVRTAPWLFLADRSLVGNEMRVRAARAGDRIVPFGFDHSRKLHDVFIDRKVPRSRRWNWPVLEVQGQIVWVPGVIRSAFAPVTEATAEVLVVSVAKLGVAGA